MSIFWKTMITTFGLGKAESLPDMFASSDPVEDAEIAVLEIIDDVIHIMEKKQISKSLLAKKLGVSQSAVSQFMKGDQNISLYRLTKIAHALGARLSRPTIYLEAEQDHVNNFILSRYLSHAQTSGHTGLKLPEDHSAKWFPKDLEILTSVKRLSDSPEVFESYG